MHARELRNGRRLWEGRDRQLSKPHRFRADAQGVIMILIGLPFIAVMLGADPQFSGGVVLTMLAVVTAGYAMAQLMWEAAP